MAMLDLDQIYDRAFFGQWGRRNSAFVDSARMICDELHARFQPRRLIDLGCGAGVYAERFAALGTEVVAIDGVMPPEAERLWSDVNLRDLTEPFENVWGAFDLALCLDVGEHIPEDQSAVFLANICQFADTLLLACAPPGQGGTHHVNEQPKRYWIARMAEHGFHYNRPATGRLCETFKVMRPPLMWMWEHISVYERSTPAAKR